MPWSVVVSALVLVPLILGAVRLNGWTSWTLWVLVVIAGLNVIIYVWLRVIWHSLLFWLRDYF